MVRGVTFDKQLMTSEDFAHQTNYFYRGKHGITKGCTVSKNTDNNLVISDGYFMVYGRQIANVGNTVVVVPSVVSGILYSKLVFTINLSFENTVDNFGQGFFEIISSPTAYPTPIQENLDVSGKKFQLEFCSFENVVSGVTNLIDTRSILSMNAVDADTLDGKHATAFATAVHSHPASQVSAGALPVGVLATNSTDYTISRVRNARFGTTVPASLANGEIYFMYE